MSAALEPITRERLHQFRRRWQLLQTTRGFSFALVLAIALLFAVVLIDAAVVVPLAVRWCLSLTIYAALVGWLLATALAVWRQESLPATARAFEELDPRLREQLLSAVELSEDSESNCLSSPAFRSLLQQQVARAVAPVRMRELLPWSTIVRGVVVALCALAMGFGLTFVPGLHWPHRVARALLPGANLGRISRFDVEIISPNPASSMLPLGDVAAIEARVRGPLPDNVQLETRVAGETELSSMRGITRFHPPASTAAASNGSTAAPTATATAQEVHADDLVYTANVTLGSQEIEYRVIAEDAHTAWHRLSTKPRPQANQFRMTIVQPTYSGLPNKQHQSPEGDIEVLRGSRVRLQIETDQSVGRAWLQLNAADATAGLKIDLQPEPQSDRKVVTAEMPIDKDFSYRVHLESAETKFTNAFSPEYRVRALEDVPPRLTWVKPEGNVLVVEPNQVVPLSLHIEDELPLAEALLLTSINGEPPGSFQLESIAQAEVTVTCDLDLLKIKPRLGDSVRVMAQGTDRAGQATLSAPIELIVSSTAIDPQRRPATEQRIDLASDLRKLSEQVQPQAKRVRELHEQYGKSPSDSALAELKTAAKQLSDQAANGAKELREKVATQLKLSQDSVSLAELERTGQVLARVETELTQNISELLQTFEAPRKEGQSDSQAAEEQRWRVNNLRGATEKIADATGVLDRRFREFVSHDVLAEVARGLSVVQDFQQQLAANADDVPPVQLRRRQAIVARQLRELEQIMIDRSPLLRDGASNGMRGWIEWAGQMAERVERASADTDDNPNFKEFTKQVLGEVNNHQHVLSVDGGLAGEITNGRKELDARSESAAATLAQLAKASTVAAGSPETKPSAEMRDQVAAGLELLQHRKKFQQARGDSNAHHVNDLGNAIRATKTLLYEKETITPEVSKQLNTIAAALKKLESIHNVNEASKHLGDLEQIERWKSSSADARTESPRTWDALQQRLEQAARALREAGIDNKLADELDQLRWDPAANEAGQKIGARRWSSDGRVSAEAELAELRVKLDATRGKLDEVARAARAELVGLAPSVSALARKAAEETEQLQEQTSKLSKAAAADEVPDLKSRLDQLSADQQRTIEPINDLRDALTEMAAVQDLLNENQRELAHDADTSQQIIDKASEQISESLQPATSAENATAAAAPLEKAANAQSEATAALEQIADHFKKLQAGDFAAGELADSRQALKNRANAQELAAMEEWYKTAEALSKLAGGDPEQVLKKLEDELSRNARMREELSDISKQAVDESVQSLHFSAEQERNLQSQLEQSDPVYATRKGLLFQDIQAASERMHQWMQQLSNDTKTIAGRANARAQQKQLSDLQEQLQQTLADTSAARDSLPLQDLQHIAQTVVQSLETAQKEFAQVADALEPTREEAAHANEQELRNRKREMEDWERRTLQQQARGAQAVERSHEQRVRQAENTTRNAETQMRNSQRQRDEVEKQANAKPEDAELKRRLVEASKQFKHTERDHAMAQSKQEALKQRFERAKQIQQEMTTRKPSDLNSKNPTAELATRFARAASSTSDAIGGELEKALADTGWMSELAASQNQLQSSEHTQGRVEQAVQGVADNLDRAARHEQRLEHPQAAQRIGAQAQEVKQAKEQEVHAAKERLLAASEQAKAAADQPDFKDSATPVASLAARQAISEAESELRTRISDLKAMLEQPATDEAAPAAQEPAMPPGATSVPLDPKMLARMLDELDRQMGSAEDQPAEDANQAQSTQSAESGKSEDDNNKASSQQSSPNGKKKGSQTASMQEASRQLAEQMNRQRAQGRQSTAASRMTSNTADTKAAPPSSVRVLSVDRRSGSDWGKLREQAADQTVESARQTVAPQYRQSVETYFRVLSERGHRANPK